MSTRASPQAELERLQTQLAERDRQAAAKEAQLEHYAADLRETFKSERARSRELEQSYVATVRALTNAVEARDAYTGKHAERVAAYGLEIARPLAPDLAADPQTEFGFLLHDVGKVAIPDGILHKGDTLTEAEETLMRQHPLIGWGILHHVPYLEVASQVVRSHHERWDGKGYPDGLAGDAIPLAARIFSVVDTLDAITTDRPYRKSSPLETARRVIREASETQFDPQVVDALDQVTDARLEELRRQVG